jgi:prolyl-tRNA synthetase
LPIENSFKAVVYQKNATDEYVVVFIRGDLDTKSRRAARGLYTISDDSLYIESIGPRGNVVSHDDISWG